MTRADAVGCFQTASLALIAAGLPPDVVRATLRPLWRAVLLTLRHEEAARADAP